jgi:guanine deaminase
MAPKEEGEQVGLGLGLGLALESGPAPLSESSSSSSSSSSRLRGLRACVIHSISFGELEVLEDAVIVYDEAGVILSVLDMTREENRDPSMLDGVEVADHTGKLVIPGFVDAHCHAPQHVFTGTGMGLPLLEWLQEYTFPTEAKFSDNSFARDVYKKVVSRHLKFGTTFASYFATLHREGSQALADACLSQGQRAHIGKVTMDRNSPDFYVEESTETALIEAESFARYTLSLSEKGLQHVKEVSSSGAEGAGAPPLLNRTDTPRVLPVITPRFVPTCSEDVMKGLGLLAKKYGIPVQSHLSETPDEMKWVSSLHPDCETYAHVYEQFGLLGPSSYMAHCCHSPDKERALLAETGTGVVHCPSSNFTLCSGVMDVRMMVEEGITVGLGTDVAGGYSPSMLDAMRQTLIASRANVLSQYKDPTRCPKKRISIDDSLDFRQVFHLATVGGAKVLGMGDVLGNFMPGKKLDALVVDVGADHGPVDLYGHESLEDLFSKFLFTGDDRNIENIYVDGNLVLGNPPSVLKIVA